MMESKLQDFLLATAFKSYLAEMLLAGKNTSQQPDSSQRNGLVD